MNAAPQHHVGGALGAWFRKSRVVDEHGLPLVVYHGTRGSFPSFELGRAGNSSEHASADLGFFFSASPCVADIFTRETTAGDDSDLQPAEQLSEGANLMPVYLRIESPFVMQPEHFIDFVEEATGRSARALRALLIAEGHDGVYIPRSPRYLNAELIADTWVAFEPEQIKGVFNCGSYEAASPEILRSSSTPAPAARAGFRMVNAGERPSLDGTSLDSLTRTARRLGVDLEASEDEHAVAVEWICRTHGRPGDGAAVLMAVADYASDRGKPVVLDAYEGQEWLLDYYQRLGFVRCVIPLGRFGNEWQHAMQFRADCEPASVHRCQAGC